MAIKNAKVFTHRPIGLSDSQDGSNTFSGAMLVLQNLVPSPTTKSVFVPRPAAQEIVNFAPFNMPTGVTAFTIVGSRMYGMISTSRNPGHDEPFCYDLKASAYIPVSGVLPGNVPATQPTVGDWTPPTIVAFPSRVIVTHPGFPGGAGPYIGWFDISSFVAGAIKGNTTAGSPVIASVQTPTGTSAPILSGVQPGQAISGPGIPAGATVVSAANGIFSANLTGNTTNASPVVTGLASTAGITYGMSVASPAFSVGAYVISVDSGTQITLSENAVETAVAVAIDVSGGGSITISENATATANGVAVAIEGGTLAAPLWGAGNLNTYPLSSVPACVGQFNGRAYYGVGNFLVFSDSLNPTQLTNANQALTLGDNQAITALAGLPYTNTVTGGVVAALIAFKGTGTQYQITGDAATSNLQQNAITGGVGTLAPSTICATPLGLAYVATDGLRVLGLTGQVSEPIGTNGQGVNTPLINALYPSRMCAAYGQDVMRISLQNPLAAGQPFQEYWYDFDLKIWTGPHTFAANVIGSYPIGGAGGGFIAAPVAAPAALYQSGVIPVATSTYAENNAALSWNYTTTLGPDNADMANNQVVESTIMLALGDQDTVRVIAFNEANKTLDTVYIDGYVEQPTLWGEFQWGRGNYYGVGTGMGGSVWGAVSWGAFDWGVATGPFVQYPIDWTGTVDFKQMSVEVLGTSSPGQSIGNLYIKYSPTGFLTQGPGI